MKTAGENFTGKETFPVKLSTVWMAKKREQARQAGLCITCYKQKPAMGRSVCGVCNASRHERIRRATQRKRDRAALQGVIEAHERAGDVAQEHHLYDEAVGRYRQALAVEAIDQETSLRIIEKLAASFFFGANPKSAKPWLEKALAAYSKLPSSSAKVVKILLTIAGLSWVDGNVIESVALSEEAVKIAEESRNTELRRMTSIHTAGRLNLNGRQKEARRLLELAGNPESLNDVRSRALFYTLQGSLSAAQGKKSAAYRSFERVAPLLDERSSLSQIVSFWNDYACAAATLGDIHRGRGYLEKVLLIVRRNNYGWRIPYFTVNYADYLFTLGRYDDAREYMNQALYSDADAPIMEYAFAEIGIPIGLYFKDEKILARCTDPTVLEMVLQSGHMAFTATIAASFAHLYASRGKNCEAQELLHRILETVHPESALYVLDFLLAVAQVGALSDASRSRALIEYRTKLPHSAVSQAYLALFDAHIEQRLQRTASSQKYATDAARRFEALDWHRYADLARALVPSLQGQAQSRQAHSERPFAALALALTGRERQVAELVIRGYTNRQIAADLSISKYTVESHVRSVMNRLGIRSRHQMGDVLP